jgi:hypothetical protein
VRYFEELLESFPPREALTEEELEQGATPWAVSPEGSDRLLWLSIGWSADADGFDVSILAVTWVLVFVGGFVTLVAVLSTAAIAHEAWRVRATRAQ